MKTIAAFMAVLILLSFCPVAYCAEKQIPESQILAIAVRAAKDKGVVVAEARVIYDEGGKLWVEKAGAMGFADSSPNHGILVKGFLKNYRIVYFDFKEPLKDIWVFVDKDTGEVLTVYREE